MGVCLNDLQELSDAKDNKWNLSLILNGRTLDPKKPRGTTPSCIAWDFFDMRLPVSGTRLVWAVVGYKWVRICTPIQTKFRVDG